MIETPVKAQIREYINQNILFEDDAIEYSDDDSFLEKGIVDSFGIMELILFVEQHLGKQVEQHDVTPDNFDSVNRLATYIQSIN
jgi:acyl carrier protein